MRLGSQRNIRPTGLFSYCVPTRSTSSWTSGRTLYATELRGLGYADRILSCEPLLDAYETLQDRAGADALWQSLRTAVGDRVGEANLQVAGNSVSSSLLPMLARHAEVVPESRYVAHEVVPITTIDALMDEWLRPTDRPYLKSDTQGNEHSVLKGAVTSLDRFLGVQLELSLVPLYEGGMLLEEGLSLMRDAGFTLMSVQPGFMDRGTGQLLQCDGIFFRGTQPPAARKRVTDPSSWPQRGARRVNQCSIATPSTLHLRPACD